MKKIILSTCLLFSIIAQAQLGVSLKNTEPIMEQSEDKQIYTQQVLNHSSAKEAILWSEDFANGIPSNWQNYVTSSNGAPLPNGSWEYRGPSTIPSNATGSRGGSAGAGTPLLSPTAANGYVIFDSDYLDDAGISSNAGNGQAPAPHVGILITDTMDLTGHPFVELKINASVRRLDSDFLMAVSTDGGITYKDTINLYSTLSANTTVARDAQLSINVSSSIGNEALVRIAFIFEGAGRGSYYWMMDDIEVRDLPANELRFTEYRGAPAHDMIFEPSPTGSVHPKQGHISFTQRVPVNFDSNILNHGYKTQTNVTLEVEVFDSTSTLVNTLLSSPPVASIAIGDTVDFNSFFTSNWTPTVPGQYTIVYTLKSDSINTVAPRDSFNFFVTADPLSGYAAGESNSLDNSVFNNSLGTNALGEDGCGMAVQLNFSQPNRADGKVGISAFEVGYSGLTVDGGDIQFEIYDTTNFSFTGGFGTGPIFSQIYSVDSGSSGQVVRYPLVNASGNVLTLDPDQYFFALYMYSNAGANLIRIANDASFASPGSSQATMFNSDDVRWYSGYNNSRNFNAPWIRVISEAENIGLEENKVAQLSLYPNPAHSEVMLTISKGGKYTVELVDITGKIIVKKTIISNGNEKHFLNLDRIDAGVYNVKAYNQNISLSSKLVIR